MALKLNADNPIARHYDKLIVVAVLIALLVSLFYLTGAAGPARAHEQAEYKRRLQSFKPSSANLGAIDMSEYEDAARQARAPLQLELPGLRQAGFFAPETRVVCVVKECKKLIPYAAKECPFCGGKQPLPKSENPNLDSDGDGIPDLVEIQLGLNPHDPSDAKGDLDGDGFSNLEEFLAGTDPKDPKSHPALANLLRVKELRGKRLPILFSAKSIMPDGKVQFQFRDLEKNRTFFEREGNEIGKSEGQPSGFVVGAFAPKTEKQERNGLKVEVDVSTVVVKRLSDNKEVSLKINDKMVKVTDVEAVVVLTLDNTEYTVLEGGALKVRDEAYRVLSLDSVKTTVTIENEATGQQKVIPKLD